MSPIFNHHALRGLPSSALHNLRAVLMLALAATTLNVAERTQLHAALQAVDAALCSRAASPAPPSPAPSP